MAARPPAPSGATILLIAGRAAVAGFDRIWPMGDLHAALAEADIVVVLTPYSERTHHLFDEAAFAAQLTGAQEFH